MSATSTSAPHIDQLFNTGWLKSGGEKGSGLGSWVLWVYAPIGLLVFLLRLPILLQFFLLKLILPQSKLKGKALRVMGVLLGVTVTTEGEVSEGAKTFIANHISAIDHFVIHVLTQAKHYREQPDVPRYLESLFGITSRAESDESRPLLFFPEGESTNGVTGLLVFGDLHPQADLTNVQPIGLSISRSLLNTNTMDAGFGSEIFFTLFSINTHYTLKFLTARNWDGTEMQRLLASALHLQPTKFGVSDKKEYIKKANFRPMSMASMARLVQQQLHPLQLSPESVLSALQRTGSVEAAVKELRKTVTQPSFPLNPAQRMTTFQERKRLMVEAAREKYAKQHGITLT